MKYSQINFNLRPESLTKAETHCSRLEVRGAVDDGVVVNGREGEGVLNGVVVGGECRHRGVLVSDRQSVRGSVDGVRQRNGDVLKSPDTN